MKAKIEAVRLVNQFSLSILSQIGHKLPMDEVEAIARASALVTIDKIVEVLNPQEFGLEMEIAFNNIDSWNEIKKEIEEWQRSIEKT
jgi:hypothetical protein